MANIENLTIMFTDIVGFSDLVAKLSRSDSESLLENHDQILSKVIRRFGGKKIKSVGDSFLVTFRSPTDAVLCGMAMHDALWDFNQSENTNNPIIIRVALNAGEVRLTNNDVFGDAVNIASRLEQITPANSVYLTEAVYLSMNKSEANLEDIDSVKFKGVKEKIKIYQATHKPLEKETKESLLTDNIDYPYGGAHIHYKASHSPLFTIGKLCILLCSFLLVIFATWWTTITYMPVTTGLELERIAVEFAERQPPQITVETNNEIDVLSQKFIVTNELKTKAKPLLIAKKYTSLEKLIKQYSKEYADNAYLLALQGHADAYFERYDSAIKHYKKAFTQDYKLAANGLVASNFIKLLEHEREDANRLIARYLNRSVLKALAKRTGSPGLDGRYDAFYLLRDSGHSKWIDRVGLNIWDLRELDECQLKKVAVLELKRLEDPRSLEALKEVVDVGFFERFRYACLRSDAIDAIVAIEAQQEEAKEEVPTKTKKTNKKQAIKATKSKTKPPTV